MSNKINITIKIEGSAALILVGVIIGVLYIQKHVSGDVYSFGLLVFWIGLLLLLNKENPKKNNDGFILSLIISTFGAGVYHLIVLYFTDQFTFWIVLGIIIVSVIFAIIMLGGDSNA